MIGSIGFPELIMVFAVILLLFGPKKLPEFANLLGKVIREFRKTVNEAKETIEDELNKTDLTRDLKDIDRNIKDINSDIKEITRLDHDKETK